MLSTSILHVHARHLDSHLVSFPLLGLDHDPGLPQVARETVGSWDVARSGLAIAIIIEQAVRAIVTPLGPQLVIHQILQGDVST